MDIPQEILDLCSERSCFILEAQHYLSEKINATCH